MKLSRREVLSTCPIALAGASAFAQTKDDPQYVEVKTAYGQLRGLQGAGLVTFKGITALHFRRNRAPLPVGGGAKPQGAAWISMEGVPGWSVVAAVD